MKIRRKVLATALASMLVLNGVLGTTSIRASAESEAAISDKQTQIVADEKEVLQTKEETAKECKKLPDSLVTKDKQEKHSKRLYDEEKSLNTAVFKNEDGSKTMYSFGHPIKYKDKEGNIKDISLNLESNGKGAYISEESDVIATFSETLSEGINLSKEDEDINVTMYILDKEGNKAKSKVKGDTSKATYEYDANTDIEYSLTYNGMKEDIIVDKYTGVSEYSFILLTDGLKLTEKGGCLTLVDKNNIDKVCVGDVIIYTANHKKTEYGTMSYKTIKENEEYIVTIHIDEEFLKAKDTAYPIIIDPSLEVSRTESGTTGIEDVTINSAGGSNGSATALYVGRRDSVGISRAMMKFPGLNLAYIAASDRITSAYLNIRDITQTTDVVTVKCYTFAGNEWSASTANWSNINPNSITTYLDAKNVQYGYGEAHDHTYTFNITKAVKGWKVGNMNQDKGIVLKLDNSEESGTENIVRAFGSYNRSSGQPYLVVNYSETGDLPFVDNTWYFNNWLAGTYLGYDTTKLSLVRGTLTSLGNDIKWEIRKVDGGYIIRSKADTTKYLASPVDTTAIATEMVTIEDMSIPTRCVWTITKLEDGYCAIRNVYSGRYLYQNGTNAGFVSTLGTVGTSGYRQRVWRYASTGYYGTSSSSTKTELDSGFTVDTCSIFAGESIIPTVNISPSNALWADVTDFYYSGYDTTKLSYDSLTGTFTSISTSTALYSTQITATHRVTGRSKTFSFVVNPKAVFVGVMPVENDRERNSWFSPAGTLLMAQGISTVDAEYDSFTIDEIREKLDNDNNYIFVSRSHGVRKFDNGDEDTEDTEYTDKQLMYTGIKIKEIVDKEDPFDDEIILYYTHIPDDCDLSNMGLAIFAGCYTANEGSYGKCLPQMVVDKGAKSSIGFLESIDSNDANKFVEVFFDELEEGRTVDMALYYAKNNGNYVYSGIDSARVFGNLNYIVF